ncbi:MAG: thiosulfate oxidation carrier complex protein SoxZ [Proteobacteria bacterium]|jgi:sulfur-oxidizing protein SoxZ|nr:thiosulfate oxidation carrier complex protein SoxZ [Pseudomonadota bacterium]MCG6936289.1 thiosulfate oxidation carrier complex protein SoxZ [Pseudomonadota bacterium]
MTIQTKMKIRRSGNQAEILVLVNHPMESGNRVDKKNNNRIPAHYIESISFKINGSDIADASLGPGVASNPMTGIVLNKVKPGDLVSVHWSDNKGMHGMAEHTIT